MPFLLLIAGCGAIAPVSDGDLSKVLGIVAQAQSASEQWVSSIKRQQEETKKQLTQLAEEAKKQSTEDERKRQQAAREKLEADLTRYNRAEALYIDASAAFNRYVISLRVALVTAADIRTSPELKVALDDARKRALEFVSYAREITPMPPLEPFGADAVKILGIPLSDIAKTLWDAYMAANKERRDQILKLLEQLHWKSWAEIK